MNRLEQLQIGADILWNIMLENSTLDATLRLSEFELRQCSVEHACICLELDKGVI